MSYTPVSREHGDAGPSTKPSPSLTSQNLVALTYNELLKLIITRYSVPFPFFNQYADPTPEMKLFGLLVREFSARVDRGDVPDESDTGIKKHMDAIRTSLIQHLFYNYTFMWMDLAKALFGCKSYMTFPPLLPLGVAVKYSFTLAALARDSQLMVAIWQSSSPEEKSAALEEVLTGGFNDPRWSSDPMLSFLQWLHPRILCFVGTLLAELLGSDPSPASAKVMLGWLEREVWFHHDGPNSKFGPETFEQITVLSLIAMVAGGTKETARLGDLHVAYIIVVWTRVLRKAGAADPQAILRVWVSRVLDHYGNKATKYLLGHTSVVLRSVIASRKPPRLIFPQQEANELLRKNVKVLVTGLKTVEECKSALIFRLQSHFGAVPIQHLEEEEEEEEDDEEEDGEEKEEDDGPFRFLSTPYQLRASDDEIVTVPNALHWLRGTRSSQFDFLKGVSVDKYINVAGFSSKPLLNFFNGKDLDKKESLRLADFLGVPLAPLEQAWWKAVGARCFTYPPASEPPPVQSTGVETPAPEKATKRQRTR